MATDAPTEAKLNWTVHEYLGSEVYRPNHVGEPLKSQDDVKDGDTIWVPSAFNGGYYEMTVSEDGGKLYADSEKLMVALSFAHDGRGAWCATGYINKRGLEKLDIAV